MPFALTRSSTDGLVSAAGPADGAAPASTFTQLRTAGHWPTLVTAFLYFDASFMVWTMLGALGALIAPALGLDAQQKFLMVSTPILAGAVLRIALGLLADRLGAKATGLLAQLAVMAGLTLAWRLGLATLGQALLLGVALGVAGASFAVALPLAGRWYPASLQGVVLGIAGAGNIGVVVDQLVAPRLAVAWGWQPVFGVALVPLALVFAAFALAAREPPGAGPRRRLADYARLLRERDAHWFCFFYTVSFGGFVGLATAFVLYFRDQFHLTPVHAGEMAALCTLVGAVGRPFGGALADRLGGIRALGAFYAVAAAAQRDAGLADNLWLCAAAFFTASGAFGMANGSVFQLLPQRFGREMAVMTGLVGCGGGLGGFVLGMLFGLSKQYTGGYTAGIVLFAGLCLGALAGLHSVKIRWRSTWGALALARI